MLNVTEWAGAIIKNTLEANRQAEDDVFRLTYAGSDLVLLMGAQRDGDVVIQHHDRAILVLEQSVVDALGDLTVDTDLPEGSQLIIKPSGTTPSNSAPPA